MNKKGDYENVECLGIVSGRGGRGEKGNPLRSARKNNFKKGKKAPET